MRILAIADEESKALWDHYRPERLEGVDLIISCGDLSADYLEFLVTMGNCPLLYVRGNHDSQYEMHPPEGCICIEDRVFDFHGLRILGLGGSMCYNFGAYQYTESQMKRRIRKLALQLKLRKGVDILVCHSPAFGINDGEDLPHRGFACITELLIKQKPKLFLHGHVHLNYGRNMKREDTYMDTRIINAYERHVFEMEFTDVPEKKQLFGGTK